MGGMTSCGYMSGLGVVVLMFTLLAGEQRVVSR